MLTGKTLKSYYDRLQSIKTGSTDINEHLELNENEAKTVIQIIDPNDSDLKNKARELGVAWKSGGRNTVGKNVVNLSGPRDKVIKYLKFHYGLSGATAEYDLKNLHPDLREDYIEEATKKPDWSDSMLDLYIRKDRNGNKVLKVVLPDLRFNIQTNGNLPKTHSRGAGDHTIGELVKYVKSYGSTMQKNAISIYARTKIDEGVDKSSPIYKEYEELKDHSIQSRLNRENETTELEEDATTDLVKMGIGAAAGAVGLGVLAKKRLGKDGRTNAKAKKLEKEADAKERLKKAQERLKNAKEGKRDAETPKQKETAKETEKNALDSIKKALEGLQNAKDKLKETVELSEVSKGVIAKALGGPAFANDTLYMQVFKDAGDSKKREESLGRLKKARGAEAYERTKKALKRLEDHGFKFEEVESAELQEGSDVTLESYIQTENSSWARQIKHLPGQPYIAVVKNKDGQEKYIGKTSYSDHTTALEEGSLWLKTVKNGVPQMVVERTISGFINSAVKEGKVTFK